MKTKSDLLAVMAEYEACPEATDYVTDHTSDSAEEIGLSCDQIDWLIWLLVYESVDLTEFVNGCIGRAGGYVIGCDARFAIEAAIYVGDLRRAGYASAYYIAHTTRKSYGYTDAERKAQLEQLHDLWKKWCRS